MLIGIKIRIHVELGRKAALFEQVLRGKFCSPVHPLLECPCNTKIMSQSWLVNPLPRLITERNLVENFWMPSWTLKTTETQGKSPRFKVCDDLDSKHSKIKDAAILWNPVHLPGCSWAELICVLNAPVTHMKLKSDSITDLGDAGFPLLGRFPSLLYPRRYKDLSNET